MKKWLPWIITGVFAAWVLGSLAPHADKTFHYAEFGKLPVLLNGRVQPFESVARNSLMQIRGKTTAPIKLHFSIWDEKKRGRSMSATAWLLEVMAKPELADTRKVFRIDHPELVSLLKLAEVDPEKGEDGKHYSWNDLKPQFDELQKQAQRASGIDAQARSAFERSVVKLVNSLMIYQRLKFSLQPEGAEDFAADLAAFQKNIAPGVEAVRNREAGKPFDEKAFDAFMHQLEQMDTLARSAQPLIIPSAPGAESRDNWDNIGAAILKTVRGEPLRPAVSAYAAMATAFRHDRVDEFNQAVAGYHAALSKDYQRELMKADSEHVFNRFQPFYLALTIYVVAFLCACVSWFNWTGWLRQTGYNLMILSFVVHTAGLLFRMILEGRPPVTNLYSSAIFIGWGSVVLGAILERFYRDGIGTVVGSFTGFVTLVIAHNLSTGGDTMEMMRAVLDSNFWLATHVVTITLGYSATFAAGLLAIMFILRGVLTRSLSEETAKAWGRMTYGIICFATLFSFIGTVLGGIWADQSWGRFWGWDPKENGALIIVLWNATILHARWGGMVRERGLMNLAIFGNIVTSFSWFGVNMLGIGLHSYGFMDSAFKWLMLFIGSQVLFIALGALPLRKWASFRHVTEPAPAAKLPAKPRAASA